MSWDIRLIAYALDLLFAVIVINALLMILSPTI